MSNTIVTVKYSNGSEREFIASDALEALINEGEMFSITTMHSDMGQVEELAVSKMYAGNPVAAMGHMMIMKRNAENMLNDDDNTDDMEIVIQTLTACIKLLSDEVTSHQSGMVDITQMGNDEPDIIDNSVKCPVSEAPCEHYIFQPDHNGHGEVGIEHCKHPKNPQDGKCVHDACPYHEDYVPF